MSTSNQPSLSMPKTLLRVVLFAEALAWLPLALVGILATANVGGIWTLLGLAIPVLIAAFLSILALEIKRRPCLYAIAATAALLSAALLGWIGYELYPKSRYVPPLLTQGYDFHAHESRYGLDQAQSVRWTAFLQKRFPPGSSVEEMRKTLDASHFGYGASYKNPYAGPYGGYQWSVGRACFYTLFVYWRATPAGRIAAIKGDSMMTEEKNVHCK
jgi:hypothetical protein